MIGRKKETPRAPARPAGPNPPSLALNAPPLSAAAAAPAALSPSPANAIAPADLPLLPGAAPVERTFAQALADICAILGATPLKNRLTFDALNWMVAPALAASQYRIFAIGERPVAFALWAMLDEATERRFAEAAAEKRVLCLAPPDWTSGPRRRIVAFVRVGPFNNSHASERHA